MTDEPKKKGRPFGKRIPIALEAAHDASLSIEKMQGVVANMTDNQRILFESIMSGDDALITCLKSGHTEWYTGIVKVLRDQKGDVVLASRVTLDNVNDLSDESYRRLISVCDSKLQSYVGSNDYQHFVEPIHQYIKKFTPLALGNIVSLSKNSKKDDVRLRASQDILNRAGEKAIDPEREFTPSVQVNILLTGENGTVIPYHE